MKKEPRNFKEATKNVFESTSMSEIQKRAFAEYALLEDRTYINILPKVLAILNNENIYLSNDMSIKVWSKIMAFAIYIMTCSILGKLNRQKADEFNVLVYQMYLRHFEESIETLKEYEKENPTMGDAQPLWTFSKQILEAINREDITLAVKLLPLVEDVNKLDINTTIYCLEASLDDLKKIVSCISIQPYKL